MTTSIDKYITAAEKAQGINKLHPTIIVSLDLIDDHADNPRGEVDEADPQFAELMSSMETGGLLEPIVAVPQEGRYLLIAGHRRRRAAVRLKWTKISCTIVEGLDLTEQLILMLWENIHRQQLTYLQEARGFARIQQEGKNTWEIARDTKVTRSYVESRLPLLKLTLQVQKMLDAGDITLGAANQLVRLDPQLQDRYSIRAQQMSVKNLEKLVSNLLRPEISPAEGNRRKLRRQSSYKVLDQTEQYTRSWALRGLEKNKDKKFTTVEILHSFDDVCQDACIEDKSELACMGCPIPRLVASLLKRTGGLENLQEENNG